MSADVRYKSLELAVKVTNTFDTAEIIQCADYFATYIESGEIPNIPKKALEKAKTNLDPMMTPSIVGSPLTGKPKAKTNKKPVKTPPPKKGEKFTL
jgi:hypothetical protein